MNVIPFKRSMMDVRTSRTSVEAVCSALARAADELPDAGMKRDLAVAQGLVRWLKRGRSTVDTIAIVQEALTRPEGDGHE